MLIVGLTGGLASGKTTVAKLFESCGAKVIDADILARQVVRPGKAAWKDIVRSFGKSIQTSKKTLDRTALARTVFRDPVKLKRLTDIIHPRVAREQARVTRQITARNPRAVIVYDAALLIEAGAHRRMDAVIVVKADRTTQIARACRRGGLTRAQAEERIRNQMPLRKKLQYADYIIDGTLPLSQLRKMVRDLFLIFQEQARYRNRHPLNSCNQNGDFADSKSRNTKVNVHS